jgi:hypothetical protein
MEWSSHFLHKKLLSTQKSMHIDFFGFAPLTLAAAADKYQPRLLRNTRSEQNNLLSARRKTT